LRNRNLHLVVVSVVLSLCTAWAQSSSGPNPQPIKETYSKLAAEVEATLHRDVLDVWFPRTLDDKNGGFQSGFDREWRATPSEGKFAVFQGRMTWISSQVAMRRPELRDKFLPIARHGLDFLNDLGQAIRRVFLGSG